jgi:D-lactate dehydrogenase
MPERISMNILPATTGLLPSGETAAQRERQAMRIVFFEVTDWERAACERLAPEHSVTCVEARLNEETAAPYADAEAVSTFIRSELSAAALRQIPGLGFIATRSTGVDHIDLDYCRAAGLAVSNVPDYGDHTVAEHAFALLLALSRRVLPAVERTRRGDFSTDGLCGFDLAGKTIGVIGMGRIGRRAASIARGFNMQVLAFDVAPDLEAAAALGVRHVPLDELLANSDVITLHVPGEAGTRHLIGAREFARMKSGVVLINTSRGGAVDAVALLQALASGRLAAAGLDVVSEERALGEEAEIFRVAAEAPVEQLRALVADHALLSHPNVIVTPHIAYNTREAVERITETTLENIAAFAAGAPRNLVV